MRSELENLDFRKFKAALFDFDGTITERCVPFPDQKMAEKLVKLTKIIPIGICTGRQMDSFKKRGLGHLLSFVDEEQEENFLKNLFVLAENGAIGFVYNPEKAVFEEFYHEHWPEDFISREKFKVEINEVVRVHGHVYDVHEVCVVTRTNYHESCDIKKIYDTSDQLYELIANYLKKYSADYDGFLHVGNSGIGVVVGPANGDKDRGIRQFGEYLCRSRQFIFDENLREILVIGDQPFETGNDHYFLNGEQGTPFTVGDFDAQNKYPLPVLNESGSRLLHTEGTMYLIGKVLRGQVTDS